MNAYLERFERYVKVQGWRKEEWAVSLSALLAGKGLEVLTWMAAEDVNDYDKLSGHSEVISTDREVFKEKF